MSTDLRGCEIHVDAIEQHLPPHIYLDRYYNLSIFLKCGGVPKNLDSDNEIKLVTSIIRSDNDEKLNNCSDFTISNPSYFNKSGYTSTSFKIDKLSINNKNESYRIKCEIENKNGSISSIIKPFISCSFCVVQYKFGMTKQLQLIDGDKWYKDEGGKLNFLEFEMGLHDNNDKFIKLYRDIKFCVELVYDNDKSKVLNQNILKIDNEQSFILHNKNNGKEIIRFKIEQVSSHHQRRRFCLKVIPINDKTIGPCFSKPILVLSKRNKPKKNPLTMSPQKRKEVATKKKNKNKRKRKRKIINHNHIIVTKKRKLLNNNNNNDNEQFTDSNDDHLDDDDDDDDDDDIDDDIDDIDDDDDDDYFYNDHNNHNLRNHDGYNINNNNSLLNDDKYGNITDDDDDDDDDDDEDDDDVDIDVDDDDDDNDKLKELMLNECLLREQQYPSLYKYNKNPSIYFDYDYMRKRKKKKRKKEEDEDEDDDDEDTEDEENADYNYLIAKKMKKNLIKCLRLSQDTFRILSARAIYHPLYGFNNNYTSQIIYYCSFCHRYTMESPQNIPHYQHCRILDVIKLLKGEKKEENNDNDDNDDDDDDDEDDDKNANETPLTLTSIESNTSNNSKGNSTNPPIPIDNGVEYNSLESPKDDRENNVNFNIGINNINNNNINNINNNDVNNAMLNAMLQIPNNSNQQNISSSLNAAISALPIINNTNNNQFAAALNQLLLQNVTNNNNHNNNNNNNDNNNNASIPGFIFGGNPKSNAYAQLFQFNNK